MPKRLKSIRKKSGSLLSPELQDAFAHFLERNPPKQFSRNLRNVLLEVVTCQQGNHPLYLNTLLLSMEMFFEVLDAAEDEEYHNNT
ncbi:MAG: hypothetical protein WKF87_20350 [Chryseolinea sp.]